MKSTTQIVLFTAIVSALVATPTPTIAFPLPASLLAFEKTRIRSVQVHREASSHSVLTSGDIEEFNRYSPAESSAYATFPRTPVVAREPSDVHLVRRKPSHSSSLNKYVLHANANAKKIHALAAQSSSKHHESVFGQLYSKSLTAFYFDVLGFQSTLAELRSIEGLDQKDQNLVKELSELIKDTLKITDDLVADIPGLGDILEPILYDLKCILDKILDFLNDLLNSLGLGL